MKTVLVADDYKTDVEDLIKELGSRYNVIYVTDGYQAERRIAQGGIDAAILDGKMELSGPEWSGCSYNQRERYKQEYHGINVALNAREKDSDIVLVLRSTCIGLDDRQFLNARDIFTHEKKFEYKDEGIHFFGDELVLEYLREKLGE